jgi:chemotaxis regulatin CheY-phosphate phosphatase CheZ
MTRPATELLYDSEASLRLVDSALRELHEHGSAIDTAATDLVGQIGSLASLSRTLFAAYAETAGILRRIRESRGVLERASVERLQQMNDKLREVTSATEVAATDILNGLDRAVGMVGDLDAAEADGPERRAELRAQLQDELYGVMVHPQFQDITTQQLSYASSVIEEMEQRLSQVVECFAPFAMELDPMAARALDAEAHGAPAHFDPAATTANAAERQAVADEIFRKTA